MKIFNKKINQINKVVNAMFLGLVVLLVHLLGSVVADDFTAVVETSTGPVQGVISRTVHSTDYAAFKGIRYAEAPVGNLRFKPPVPVNRWTEPLLATFEGDSCPQYEPDSHIKQSEDCLFLNVFTPEINLSETPTELKAVMVWIHEGTFADGSGSTYVKQPDFLLEGGVVFVSMNYRLGALGFLSLDHRDASGNQGLKDQSLALKWVQANIEKFGGNPNKVTIFGKGAGAVSVGLHVLSDASAGLFHRAISMSGTPLVPHSFVSRSKAAARGRAFANLVNKHLWKMSVPCVTNESCLKILRKAPLERLLKKTQRMEEIAPFVPSIEKPTRATEVFLSEDPIAKYKSGKFNKVPHILGSTQLDTILYFEHIQTLISTIQATFSSVDVLFGQENMIFPFIKRGEKQLGLRIETIGQRTAQVSSDVKKDDILIIDPVAETGRLLIEKNDNNPVYHYHFVIPPNSHLPLNTSRVDMNLNDAAYAHDLAYIFYLPPKKADSSSSLSNDPMVDRVSTLWTNFAKYGKPTANRIDQGPVQIAWPASKGSGPSLLIDNELTIESNPPINLVGTVDFPYSGLTRFFFES